MAREVTLELSFYGYKKFAPECSVLSKPDICRVREVHFRLVLTRTLRQESCVAKVAISWLDRWQRHFLLHRFPSIYAGPGA